VDANLATWNNSGANLPTLAHLKFLSESLHEGSTVQMIHYTVFNSHVEHGALAERIRTCLPLRAKASL
jgi:hypothetical protein